MKGKGWLVAAPVIIVLAIFISWYCILRHDTKPVVNNYNSYLQLNDSVARDSMADSVFCFMQRVDSIEKDVKTLREKYQSEVDLMIDKANGWLAFWIGVLALVIGLMSIWQIYRQNKSEKDFQRLEGEVNGKIEEKYKGAENQINKAISNFEQKIVGFDKQLFYAQQTLRASKLSSLMMCLSSFPDPQMASDTADKKHQMYVVLKHVSATFREYVDSFCKEEDTKAYEIENTYLVLTVVKLAVVRTHGIYSDIHQNILIQKLLDLIGETNREILNGEIGDKLPQKIRKIDFDLRNLLRVVEL